MLPTVYSPGGTFTIPPPFAAAASSALRNAFVALSVRVPVAPNFLTSIGSVLLAVAVCAFAGVEAPARRQPPKRAPPFANISRRVDSCCWSLGILVQLGYNG